MKKTRTITKWIMAVLLLLPLLKQEANAQSFTLAQAQDYAVKNSVSMANADVDTKIARAKLNELTGAGLPQLSGSMDIKDYIKIPTSFIPGEFFGGKKGTFIPVKFGTQYVGAASVSASQLLFSTDYLVALQASKTYMELSTKAATANKIEVITGVSKAYYGTLVAREKKKLLDVNIDRLNKLLQDTKALNTNGFVEKLDVDRIEVSYNNLLVEKDKVDRLIGLSETLLKFQMGYDLTKPITLADSLSTYKNNLTEITNAKIDAKNRIEYSTLLTQQRLAELDLKRNKLDYSPSLVAYGSAVAQAQRTEFDFFAPKHWYPIGIVGLTLNVPIFDGFQTNARIQQAKLTLMKVKNGEKQLENALAFEGQNAVISYQNAMSSLKTQQRNIELADNIYKVTKVKYEQGQGSNLEVVTAEAAFREAQTNYFSALYDALVAKTDYDKATGSIK